MGWLASAALPTTRGKRRKNKKMKRLMIAAVAVCAAAMTQAASISWTSNNMSLTDAGGVAQGGQLTGYTLVLVNLGSTIDWDKATVIPSVASATSEKTTFSFNTSTGSKRGRVNGQVNFSYASGADNNFIDNGDYLALMFQDSEGNLSKLTYTATGAEVGNEAVFHVSGLSNNQSSIPATDAKIGLTGNFTAAVPEPTSALLMLLGVAGLAIRRRRA